MPDIKEKIKQFEQSESFDVLLAKELLKDAKGAVVVQNKLLSDQGSCLKPYFPVLEGMDSFFLTDYLALCCDVYLPESYQYDCINFLMVEGMEIHAIDYSEPLDFLAYYMAFFEGYEKSFNKNKHLDALLYRLVDFGFLINPEKMALVLNQKSKEAPVFLKAFLTDYIQHSTEVKTAWKESLWVLNEDVNDVSDVRDVVDGIEVEHYITPEIEEKRLKLLERAKPFIKKGKREPLSGVKRFHVLALPFLTFKGETTELGSEVTYYLLSLFKDIPFLEENEEAKEYLGLFESKSMQRLLASIHHFWAYDAKTKWIFGLFHVFADAEWMKGLGSDLLELAENKRSVLARKLVSSCRFFVHESIIKELEYIQFYDQKAYIRYEAITELTYLERLTKKTRNELVDPYLNEDKSYLKERLHQLLYLPHFWNLFAWKQLFIEQRSFQIFAKNLIWGVYDEAGKLLKSFRLDEELEAIDASDNEVLLEASSLVTILHPSELQYSEYQAWREHLEDYEISQPIEQFYREYLDLNALVLHENANCCTPAKNYLIGRKILRTSIIREGWDKGYALDHGNYDTYVKHLDNGYYASIRFDGDAPHANFYDPFQEIKLYELSFRNLLDKSKMYMDIPFKELPLRLIASCIQDIQKVLTKGKQVEGD